MTSQPPISDRDYLEYLLVRIEQHGVVAEHHSNLVSIASTLHHLRTQETDPRDRDLLDAKLDAIMRVIERREPHVPRSIDEHLDDAEGRRAGCEELHQRMLDILEAAVDRLASARPGGAS